LIERYHLKDIIKVTERISSVKAEPPVLAFRLDEYLNEFNKVINTNRLKYANEICNDVYLDETFLDNTVNTHPYLFTDYISKLSYKNFSNEDFINKYLSILILNNNYHLIRELKNNQNYSEHTRYALPEENKILRSLFLDINVADCNLAWRAYGDLTCKYLEEESTKKYSPLREKYKGQDEKDYWSFRIYQAIWFFDIMVREAIGQDIKSHMWLFYFRHFTDGLITNIPEENDYDSDDSMPTGNHYLIHEMISLMCDWIDLMYEMKRMNIMGSTSSCLGWCMHSIAITDKLSDEFKIYCFDTALSAYFRLSDHGETENRMEIMEEDFKKPILSFNMDDHKTKRVEYKRIMNLAWAKFDKIPHEFQGENGAIHRFEVNVINVINNQ
jgi:hypothetical protein